MYLMRFAILGLEGRVGKWQTFTVVHDETPVTTVEDWSRNGATSLLVAAEVRLRSLPSLDSEGLVEIPVVQRRRAEAAIEMAANLISVATGHARSLRSPPLAAAFRAEDDQELKWLASKAGVSGAANGIATGRLTVDIGGDELAALSDREDGVTLLSEALAQAHLAGRFKELLRFFERAFRESGARLAPVLAAFLGARPGLSYTPTEIDHWVVRLRGPAIHADRREAFVLEADLRAVIDRMLLASFEVLFNKLEWRSPSPARREVWTPLSGPLDTNGKWFAIVGSTTTLAAQLFDAFGAYVVDLQSPSFELSERCWPRVGGPFNAPQDLEVVEAERLAVVGATEREPKHA